MAISLTQKLRIARRMTGRPNTPRFASLFVTRKCNLSCAYCKSIDQSFVDINLNTWKQVIDRLHGFGCRLFSITGGEPLMRKDIAEIVSYICKEKKALCWMISNFGLMTHTKVDELASAGLQFLTCSLDSLKTGNQKSGTAALELLCSAKKAGIIPATLTVVTKENIEEVPGILDTVTKRGIMFDMGLFQCVGGLFSPSDNSLKVTDYDALKNLLIHIRTTKMQRGLVAPSMSYLENCLDAYWASTWKCSYEKDRFLVVNNNGSLMPCQEYDSAIPVLSLDSLSDATWRTAKKKLVTSCKGCLYGCYYQKENITVLDALLDAYTMLRH